MERPILNRVTDYVDLNTIEEQAGFRPSKSCIGQILNLTQHLEDEYERNKITGIAFLDLTVACDTVNHNKLLEKLYTRL